MPWEEWGQERREKERYAESQKASGLDQVDRCGKAIGDRRSSVRHELLAGGDLR